MKNDEQRANEIAYQRKYRNKKKTLNKTKIKWFITDREKVMQ